MGANILQYGDPAAIEVSKRTGAAVATVAALTAIPVQDRVDGMQVWVMETPAPYVFDADAESGGEAPDAGAGRWIPQGSAITLGIGIRQVRGVVLTNIADLGAFTVASNDGLTYVAGERVLLAAQTTGAQNGIYVVGVVGGGTAALTRASDYNASAEVLSGDMIVASEGTRFKDSIWRLNTNAAITLGTTALVFDMVREVRVASKSVGHADLSDADGAQTIAFAAALPVGAFPLDAFINVTEGFTDGVAGVFTADVGVNGGDIDALLDGADIAAIAKVGSPRGVGSAWGAITPAITILADVDVVDATAGALVAYVLYIDHLL